MSSINMNTTIYTTRPNDATSRLPKEMAVYDLLDKLNISYERVDHDIANTIEDCHAIDALLGIEMCKNLFLCNAQKTKFYLLMMPGEKPFKTKDLSKQIQSARLSFAKPEYMEQYLNITPGSVSVMGLMNDTDNHVQLLIDKDIVSSSYIGCHPCINTSSLKIKTTDIMNKVLPAIHHEAIIVSL